MFIHICGAVSPSTGSDVYIYIYIYDYVYTHTHTHTHIHIYVYICLYIYTYFSIYLSIYLSMYLIFIYLGVAQYNKQLTLLSNCLLITIPWMKISKSVVEGDLAKVRRKQGSFHKAFLIEHTALLMEYMPLFFENPQIRFRGRRCGLSRGLSFRM